MVKKIILVFLIITISLNAKHIPFKKYFKEYSDYYFDDEVDYNWFIAQSEQESRFNSLAISPVGAKGLMQIMDFTWHDLTKKNLDIYSPKYNIKYGIKYDKQMWNIYKAPRPMIDRISFMFGSYNAGAGHIIKAQEEAQKQGLNPNLWTSIVNTLHLITGHHSKETITYVKRIKKYYEKYKNKKSLF